MSVPGTPPHVICGIGIALYVTAIGVYEKLIMLNRKGNIDYEIIGQQYENGFCKRMAEGF